ncbi:hypothetical protein V6N13_036765 [Hibiscus sabdariffa]
MREVSGGDNTGEGMRQAVKLGAVGSWFGRGECLALMWVMGMEGKGELKWGLCSDGSGGDGVESWKKLEMWNLLPEKVGD